MPSLMISQLPPGSVAGTDEVPVNKAGVTTKVPASGIAALVTRAGLGLASVDNTSDAAKPISTATQAALDAKASLASPTFTGTVALPLGTGYVLVAKLAANAATGANVTPISLSGLVFSYLAGSTYIVEVYGAVTPTAATTGCAFQVDLSSAVTSVWLDFGHGLAATGTRSGGYSVADDASAGVSSGMPAASPTPVVVHGILITGANAGTAQLRFRSETTAVTTCLAGTTMLVRKVI